MQHRQHSTTSATEVMHIRHERGERDTRTGADLVCVLLNHKQLPRVGSAPQIRSSSVDEAMVGDDPLAIEAPKGYPDRFGARALFVAECAAVLVASGPCLNTAVERAGGAFLDRRRVLRGVELG